MSWHEWIWLIFTVFSVMFIIYYKRVKPVEGLKYIDQDLLCELKNNPNVKILDIRDPMDFARNHIPGSINIYIGRLPYVSKKELTMNELIVIVSRSESHIKRGARVLKKSGYHHLAASCWMECDTINREEGKLKVCI